MTETISAQAVPETHAERPLPHVLFFTSMLGGGGAEKHLVRVANHLDRARYRVSVAVIRGGGEYEAELVDGTPLHVLGVDRMYRAFRPLRALLRELRPELVCSFMDHANCVAIAAAAGLPGGPRVLPGVQIPPSIQHGRRRTLGGTARLLAMRSLYPRVGRIVALSEGVRGDLIGLMPRLHDRISVIPNAAYDDAVVRAGAEPLPEHLAAADEGPLLVACGRLTEQKGFSHLLRALARVRERVPARLWIVGEGELRGDLQAEAERLGVSDAVRFLGFDRNPFRYMRAADVFVLSSLWEGFGNVIVEAMSVGTAVVATDCPYGPSEIIRDGESGILVPPADEAALAEGILRVLEDAALREALERTGRERARDFGCGEIASRYGAEFDALLAPVSG